MARCGVKTLVVDKRSAETRSGHGDGIQARTLEILDSFGLADDVWNESYHMGEVRRAALPLCSPKGLLIVRSAPADVSMGQTIQQIHLSPSANNGCRTLVQMA